MGLNHRTENLKPKAILNSLSIKWVLMIDVKLVRLSHPTWV